MARGWVVQRLPDVRRRLRSVIEAVPGAVRYLNVGGRKDLRTKMTTELGTRSCPHAYSLDYKSCGSECKFTELQINGESKRNDELSKQLCDRLARVQRH